MSQAPGGFFAQAAVAVLLSLGVSCERPTAPASGAAIPAFEIAVEVNGETLETLDSARLGKTPASYASDDGHLAWRLADVVHPAFGEQSQMVEITVGEGNPVRARIPGQLEAVVAIDPDGKLLFAMVSPDDPFAVIRRSHRRDRRKARIVESPLSIRLFGRGSGLGKVVEATPVPVEVPAIRLVVEGKPPVEWSGEILGRFPRVADAPGGGLGDGAAWSLRAIAGEVGGEGARVARVVGPDGKAYRIPEKVWADSRAIPVLRLDDDNELGFWWLFNGTLQPIGGELLEPVTELRLIAPAAG